MTGTDLAQPDPILYNRSHLVISGTTKFAVRAHRIMRTIVANAAANIAGLDEEHAIKVTSENEGRNGLASL